MSQQRPIYPNMGPNYTAPPYYNPYSNPRQSPMLPGRQAHDHYHSPGDQKFVPVYPSQ